MRRAAGLFGLRLDLRVIGRGVLGFGFTATSGPVSTRSLGSVLDEERRFENSLMSVYLDIIWRNSGLEARVQSMQRTAPCASVKQTTGMVLLVLDRLAERLEAKLIGPLGQFGAQQGQLGGISLSDLEAKSAR